MNELLTTQMIVIETACKLANMPSNAPADQLNKVLAAVRALPRRASSSGWNPIEPDPKLMWEVKADLTFLKRSFAALRKGRRPPRKQLRERLESLAGAYSLVGDDVLEGFVQHTGLASTVSHAVALLMQRDLRPRLGRCRHCNDYFFAVPEGRGRFSSDYCSRKHRNAHLQHEKRVRDAAKLRGISP